MTDDVAPVSVVIAAYNAEKTLGAAVASSLGQDVRPAQVIVVDDGSLDGTASVAASFPEVVLLKQDNQGPSAARNTAIGSVSQPWVAFLDADDVWLPDKLTRQLAASARHPSAVLLAADWVRTHDGSGAAQSTPSTAAAGETPMDYRDVLVLNRFQTSTVLVRSEVLRACGGFDPALDGAEDWDMWLRCAKLGALVKVDVPLVIYRDEPTGYSKNLVRLYDRMLAMLDRERRETSLPAAAFGRVLAWHHLRFAVAFVLARQPGQVRRVARELRSAGVVGYVPGAVVTYLVPFLGDRVVRRLRRLRGIRG